MKKEERILHIEKLRQRAKDNKASNAKFHLELALQSLDKLRNTLFISSFGLVGYLGAIEKAPSEVALCSFMVSITSGFLSYIFLYFYSIKKAQQESKLEKNMSVSLLGSDAPFDDYNTLITKEKPIYNSFKIHQIWHIFQFLSILMQLTFLVKFTLEIF